jgi:hypothetical protein
LKLFSAGFDMKPEKTYAQLFGTRPLWLAGVSDRTVHSLKVLHGFKSLNQFKEWLTTNKISELKNLGRSGREEAFNLSTH